MIGGSNRMLSPVELAEFLSVQPRTVQQHWRTWGLPGIKVGKYIRFRERDVALWLERREAATARGGES